jgi:hypothetical protein
MRVSTAAVKHRPSRGVTNEPWRVSRFVNQRVPWFWITHAIWPEAAMTLARSIIVRPAAILALGLAVVALPTLATNEAVGRQSLFVITDQEGYGTGECLERQGGCGKIIADSFCESKGFKLADFYRKAAADEVTGSIASERKPPPRDPVAYIISCK